MRKIRFFYFIFLFTLFSCLKFSAAQPIKPSIDEVKLYFGTLTDFECCTLVLKGGEAPYQGFLLTPYQLVLLKDTIDSWEVELTEQLKLSEDLCSVKITQCQTNRDLIFDDLKTQVNFYSDLNTQLTESNAAANKEVLILKFVLYSSIPVAIITGIYIGTKL